ncbi:MAG TPA: PSD1 and planctomycete cytochrome C domain-containing protein [Bryobacteraceae bacterium]|nr:PSD1 and planctomycete cytochrome C domain-containing protein [Bryobacteraceae bacterium]
MRSALLSATLVLCLPAFAQEKAVQIIQSNCISCHGAAKMAGLDLRTREAAIAGGGRGTSLRPGSAKESLLYQAVLRNSALQMPPGKKGLDPADVEAIRAWIDNGALWPQGSGRPAVPNWWSFQPLRKAEPGATIDAFINAKLAENKLRAGGRAPRRTLIRRAYYMLHGVPPSPEEVEAFVKDADPQAWPKLVDKLLASPRYGERWGRHWLDVVRYADTGGFETDIYFPNAWRYRDYVIQAFNTDKPFFQFVREQVAGDEIWPDDLALDGGFQIPEEKRRHLDAKIATGMYTIGPVYHEAGLFGGQQRYEWLTDVVDTTGEAFLGMTLGCARCHDHKFDPLTAKDYHGMMAVFAGSDEREVPVVPKFSIYGYKSGYPRWLKVEELKASIAQIEKGARKRVVDKVRSRFPAAVLTAFDKPDEQRSAEEKTLAAKLDLAMTEAGLKENPQGLAADISYTPEESAARERLIRELGEAALKANPVPQTATVLGPADKVYDIFLTSRGDWRSKGPKIDPAVPAILANGAAVDSTLRRKSLAEWLTDPSHPLTARVMANRIWHWSFGRGIVATPNDFGRQGEPPTHPELLDWLASQLVENGGSIKKLQRAILLSDAWQRDSADIEANAAIDANNRFLWRANRQRVDAETLRDSVLFAAGVLNTKMGGRPVIPPLSKEEYSVMWAREQWPEAMDPLEQDRRSVYLYVKRTFPLPMLASFDSPDNSVSCARRDATTVAPQALTMMNSEFMLRQARRLSSRAEKEPDPVWALWSYVLQRAPSAAERQRAQNFLKDGALANLALVLFNTNEFLYTD